MKKLFAEVLGTALLVLLAVGTATVMFGFKLAGTSAAAGVAGGVVATALAFGLVLLALAYVLGPVSGCHVNPAVTLGFVLAGRMSLADAVGYWLAQLAGGLLGALTLWGLLSGSPTYDRGRTGLGANGYDDQSMVGLNALSAFGVEVLLTFFFVLVVLVVTRKAAWPQVAAVAIGLALTLVHLIGIGLTGTSVNPARSLGPALVVGGDALSQVWLFLLAPLVGGALAAVVARVFYPADVPDPAATAAAPPTVAPAKPARG